PSHIPSTSVRRISTGNSANVKRYGTGSSWLFWYLGIPPRVTSVRCNNKNPYVGISDGWNYRSHFADVTAAHRICLCRADPDCRCYAICSLPASSKYLGAEAATTWSWWE